MTLIRSLVMVLLAIALVVFAVLIGSSLWSLDWQHQHRAATAELPKLGTTTDTGLVLIEAGGNQFRARVAGMHNTGTPVLLLHGFPETSAMWIPLIDALASAGHRVVAFDQRGYSPGARPTAVDAYEIGALVDDAFAVAAAAGFERFHLIGHDWGAGVGWAAALTRPAQLYSYTSLSIPHVAAFAQALNDDPQQQRRSRYMYLFRTPWVPEVLFTFNHLALMNKALYGAMSPTQRDEYNQVFAEPGALTAALNWYRANAGFASDLDPTVRVPVLFIWGNADPAVAPSGVAAQRAYMAATYEIHELDAGHWLMEEATDEVDTIIVSYLSRIDLGEIAP